MSTKIYGSIFYDVICDHCKEPFAEGVEIEAKDLLPQDIANLRSRADDKDYCGFCEPLVAKQPTESDGGG